MAEIRRSYKGEEAHNLTLEVYRKHGVSQFYTLKSLAGFLVHSADLVPGGGDRTGLAQRFEAIASFGEGSHCVGKAALQQPNGTQLALVDSD